ncbi:MAG: hypothetical protein MUE37_06335 [Bacteroidales bacterium]|jgi:hypothetical protein|nr:hypothetical protein [Bacteroidales bacterium]
MKTLLSLLLLLVTITGAFSQPDQRLARSPKINYDWRPGFVTTGEITGAYGLGLVFDEFSKYYYGFTATAGYQFSRNIKAGVGTGVHIHNEGTLFPLYIDFRMNLNSQELVPYISGAGGLMFDLDDLTNETRVFINPLIGLRYIAANRTAVTFATGVMVSTGGPSQRKSFLNFKLGIEIKPRNK